MNRPIIKIGLFIFIREVNKMQKEKRERPIQKLVRFNRKELEYINKRIEQSPFNDFQNYARILLITGEVTVVDYSELERLNREVNRIGANINQIAKLAHKFEEISKEDIQELQSILFELKQTVSKKLETEIKMERIV